MGDGAWVVLGSVIGSLGSILTTLVSAQLSRRTPYPDYDRAANRLLRSILRAGPDWHDVRKLTAITGMSETDIKTYLIVLGARGSRENGQLWGLTSRNPLTRPDPKQIEQA